MRIGRLLACVHTGALVGAAIALGAALERLISNRSAADRHDDRGSHLGRPRRPLAEPGGRHSCRPAG